jgi:hypothetical protein
MQVTGENGWEERGAWLPSAAAPVCNDLNAVGHVSVRWEQRISWRLGIADL